VGVEGGEAGGVFGEMGDREGRVEEGSSSSGAGGGGERRLPRSKRVRSRSQREAGRAKGGGV
jgi:hypothetical protein